MESTFIAQCSEYIESHFGDEAPRPFLKLFAKVLFRFVYPFYKIDELSRVLFQNAHDIVPRPFNAATIESAREATYALLLKKGELVNTDLVNFTCALSARNRKPLSDRETDFISAELAVPSGCRPLFCSLVANAFCRQTFCRAATQSLSSFLKQWASVLHDEHTRRLAIVAEHIATFPKSTAGYIQTVSLRFKPKSEHLKQVVGKVKKAAEGIRKTAHDWPQRIPPPRSVARRSPEPEIDEGNWRTDRSRLYELCQIHRARKCNLYHSKYDKLPENSISRRSEQFNLMKEDGFHPSQGLKKRRKKNKGKIDFRILYHTEETHRKLGRSVMVALYCTNIGTGERQQIYMRQRFIRHPQPKRPGRLPIGWQASLEEVEARGLRLNASVVAAIAARVAAIRRSGTRQTPPVP